jgi:hypothetical protein
MRSTSIGGTLLILAIHSARCLAEANVWTGTWHLNEIKSQSPGPDFAEQVTPQGEYQVTSARFRYSFRCDGKEYPEGADRSIVCLHGTSSATDTVLKIGGKIVSRNHTEISPDNKQLTITTRPTESSAVKTHSFRRVAGSNGLSGSWQDTDDSHRAPKVMITTLSGSVFRLDLPTVQQSTEMNLDGTDAPTHGISKQERVTLSAKPNGQSKLAMIQKFDGIDVAESSLTLSSDGRSLILQSWRPGHPNVSNTLVYDKQ